MIVLFVVIVALGVLRIILALMAAGSSSYDYTPPAPSQDVHVHIHESEQTQYPDIADQLDGRLTNIVKNPMKGIL